MRADMGKVLVERPRYGSGDGSRPQKGYHKTVARSMTHDDGGPTREGIRRRYGRNLRCFNEHLGPLRRFLNSNVGRPWDKIYSDICQHVDRGNVVQKHILTHLFDYVVLETTLIDGVPCLATQQWWGAAFQPLKDIRVQRDRWYVCPKSGLLKRFRREKRTRGFAWPPPKPVATVVFLDDTLAYRVVSGGIDLIRLVPLPDNSVRPTTYDPYLQFHDPRRRHRPFGLPPADLTLIAERKRQPVACWRASRQELKRLPIPIELIR